MKTKKLLLLIAVFMVISTFGQTVTKWRGGTDGVYPDTGLLPNWPEGTPQILWSYEGLGEGHSSPVFALDHIFISSMTDHDGYITILTLDGKEVNKYKYGEEFYESYPGSRSTPVIVDDWLYIYSGKGDIYGFEALTGQLRWKKNVLSETDGENIKWGVTETLLVDGDQLFCTPGGKTNNVVSLNRKSGELIWSCAGVGDLSAYCSPMLIDLSSRKLLVTMMSSHIIGIDATTGKLLWSYEQPNQWSVHANTPIFHDNLLVCTSGYGKGTVCLNLSADGNSVTKQWFNSDFDNRIGGVVLLNGFLYASGDKNREWRCLDLKTGEEKWASSEVGKGVVIAADNKLFLYTERGELAMANATPAAFELKGITKVALGSAQHWAHPVINNGILYLRHGNALIAYKIN